MSVDLGMMMVRAQMVKAYGAELPVLHALALGASLSALIACSGDEPACRYLWLQSGQTSASSHVSLLVGARDCQGRAVDTLSADDFVVRESGYETLEATPRVRRLDLPLQLYLTLLFDRSSSLQARQAELVAAAKKMLERMIASGSAKDMPLPAIQLAVEVFAGDPATTVLRPHTDLSAATIHDLLTALDGVARYQPHDAGSTNLYGAIVQSSARLELARRRAERSGHAAAGYLVIFSDGRDTANLASVEDIHGAMTSPTRLRLVSLEQLGDDDGALPSLLGPHATLVAKNAGDLAPTLAKLADWLRQQARAFYRIDYCSPARNGWVDVSIGLRGQPATSDKQTAEQASFRFDASGFVPSCEVPTGAQSASRCQRFERRCDSNQQSAYCNANGQWVVQPCPEGTSCRDGGQCLGAIAWHTAQPATMQFSQGGRANQLDGCSASPQRDIEGGRLLCDIYHVVRIIKPRFGMMFGNSWVKLGGNRYDACYDLGPADGRACISRRLREIRQRLQVEAPFIMLAGQISEFVYKKNVPSDSWPAICRERSIDHWGADTCIPDLAKASGRALQVAWGKAFLDAGLRALVFGQARLQFGNNGTNQLGLDAADRLRLIRQELTAYAQQKGYGEFYIGLQAASGAIASDGQQQADFITGAQHLIKDDSSGFLRHALSQRGHPLYGDGDWHDANLVNNSNRLPVIVDYDNSGDPNPDHLDDVRHLANLPNKTLRANALRDHFRFMRLYNPRAAVAIPITVTLGTKPLCFGINQWVFSANACGLSEMAVELFENVDPEMAGLGGPDSPIGRDYLAHQLRHWEAIVP
jgi:hypothetical protein